MNKLLRKEAAPRILTSSQPQPSQEFTELESEVEDLKRALDFLISRTPMNRSARFYAQLRDQLKQQHQQVAYWVEFMDFTDLEVGRGGSNRKMDRQNDASESRAQRLLKQLMEVS